MQKKYSDILLFELLQVAVGNRDKLSITPSEEEWQTAYVMAECQAVIGVCFHAIQELHKGCRNQLVNLSLELKMKWFGVTSVIAEHNKIRDAESCKLYNNLKESGFVSCLLKGQSTARLYGNDLYSLRQSGDIDMWLMDGVEKTIQFAKSTGRMTFYDYHHADLALFPDTDVELHYRPTLSRNLMRNTKLQKWFNVHGYEHIIYNPKLGCNVLDATASTILALNHNFWHLMYEGIGLRQMMDYYFTLRNVNESLSDEEKKSLAERIDCFNLNRFASASAWVCWFLFDRENGDSFIIKESSLLPQPDAKAGQFLLNEIMKAGNLGHHDSRIKAGKEGNRILLLMRWMCHTFRLVKYYPKDVLWTPIGVIYISMWKHVFKY